MLRAKLIHWYPSIRLKKMRFPKLVIYALATLGLIVSGCSSGSETRKITGEITEPPTWVHQGIHPLYPQEEYFSIFMIQDSPYIPSHLALEQTLYQKLHQHLFKNPQLKTLLPHDIQELAAHGQWVSYQHIPQAEKKYHEWSNGLKSAALLAISYQELQKHNQLISQRNKEKDILSVQEQKRTFEQDQAFKRLSLEINTLGFLLKQLTHTLLASFLSHTPQEPPENFHKEQEKLDAFKPLLSQIQKNAEEIHRFREEFRVTLSSPDKKNYQLAEHPKEIIELALIYRGKPAQNLPLRLIAPEPLKFNWSNQSDENGQAHIRFASPITYTGQTQNLLGFALDPDAFSPSIRTGIMIEPWVMAFYLPAPDNSGIYLNLIEKSKATIQPGPIRKKLEELISLGDIRIFERKQRSDPGTTEEDSLLPKDFMFEIKGTIRCKELPSSQFEKYRKIQAEGTIIFAIHKGRSLVSTKIEGFALIDQTLGHAEAEEEAKREALLNAWEVGKQQFMKEVHEAFSPLFPFFIPNKLK